MAPLIRRHPQDEVEPHDLGLSHDLPKLLSRRRALTVFSGAGLLALAACADDTADATTSSSSATGTATSSSSGDEEIPEETGGPYPADGSNGVNVLTETGVVRSDITSSFGTASGTAEGVPLTVKLTVLDVSNGGGALAGAAIYLWHADRDGRYSMYDDEIVAENYLRGVQETAADGTVTFTSIFPAAYDGRWPHIHFEIYPSLDDATSATGKLRTTQLALPQTACDQVYATTGYEDSVENLSRTSLDSDMVFSDGYSLQLATVTGDVSQGMTATLNVPV